MTSPVNDREIFTIALECSDLFQKCALPGQTASNTQKNVASLFKDYEAWCVNLGVLAAPAASLDQALRYSDEIRGFVTQLLSILRRDLEFITVRNLPKDSQNLTPQPNVKSHDDVKKLQGSVEDALAAISAVLQRLDRLGATIRRYSASSLSSRVKAFAEQDNDEAYRLFTKNIVTHKYPTSTSSLHTQLAESMAYRRQRLRYIRHHQQRIAPEDRQDLRAPKDIESTPGHQRSSKSHLSVPAPKGRVAVLRNSAVSEPWGNVPCQDAQTTPSTTAWTLKPTSSAMERVRRDDSKSVISSSKASTTRVAGDLDDYPEPPTLDQWRQDPKCPICLRQLMESELKGKKWRQHVDVDLEPYVCISEDCKQPPQFFSDLALWESHMRKEHSTKWTQLVHKPAVWICDVEHDDEDFQDYETFQEHLQKQHSDLSEAEHKAVTTLCKTVEPRAEYTCPLCGYSSSAEQDNVSGPASSTPQRNDMDRLAKLAKHIGGHLRSLAFHTLNYIDSDSGSASEAGTKIMSAKARTVSHPPSGLKDVKDISAGCPEDDEPRSVSTFDELKMHQEDAASSDDTSPRIVSILPEFEEDWQGIQQTRPGEKDLILDNMMAYSLWDRAYEDLRKTKPLLVEKYEMLLSKKLVNGSEEDSNQIVNRFRGANIHERRALLDTIMGKLLEWMHDMGQDNQVTKPVMEWISGFVKDSSKISLLWVGFCLILKLLAEVDVKKESDLGRFATLTSKLPWYSAIELNLRSLDWASSKAGSKDLIKLERQASQLCRKMLELQVGVLGSGGQLAKSCDWSDLLPEVEDLEGQVLDLAMATDISIDLPRMQNGVEWTTNTIIEVAAALKLAKGRCSATDDRNIRLLHGLFKIDPRKVKRTIEGISGGPLKGSSNWVLSHADFHRFQNDPTTRILWLVSPPGSGKTMLLCSLVDELLERSTVVPYFFCRADDPTLNSGTAVLRGLLYLLACTRPSLISSHGLDSVQRAKDILTWEPLMVLATHILNDPLAEGAVLVIDALDECLANRDSLSELIRKPSRVKWIVSSFNLPSPKNELGIRTQVTLQLELHLLEMGSLFGVYIQGEVENLARKKRLSQQTSQIVRRHLLSSPQCEFLWANLILQELERIQPDRMLQWLMPVSLTRVPLYLELLKNIVGSRRASFYKRILAAAAITFRPVNLQEFKNLDPQLRNVDEDGLVVRISFCGSFLTLWERTIYFVHQSAREFLLDNASHPEILLELTDQHYRIFTTSIKALSEVLRENVYNLTDLRVSIDEILRPDPDPLDAIRYSCVNWVEHLTYSTSATALHENLRDGGMLHTFLKMHLLHWFEAFSLLRVVSKGCEALRKLVEFTTDMKQAPELTGLLADSYNFLCSHGQTMESAPLQVYASALLFSPHKSSVQQLFQQQMSSLMPSMLSNWVKPTASRHYDEVLSMAYSWDTQRLVSCSFDGTIIMWDTDTGDSLHEIGSYGSRVISAAFSVDSRLFASGTFEGLIKVWDTETCECRMGLWGNSGKANQVAFSADGKLLAAALSNGFVKIWRISAAVADCLMVLDGGRQSVDAVAFSADGQRLASGSSDGIIYLWDMATGQPLWFLEGHSDLVTSIALSADGGKLVSSSLDQTLKIWDTFEGSVLGFAAVGRSFDNISFDPTASNRLSTDIGLIDVSPSGDFSFKGYGISLNEAWILKDGKGVVPIPSAYRTYISVVRGSMVALGSESGRVLMMRFP